MADLKCEILEGLVELPEQKGYHLELNLRRWNENRSKMTKGITFSKEELMLLTEALPQIKL